MSEYKYVGGGYPIQDAWQKVSGKLTYTGDMQPQHLCYAKLLTSEKANANIVSIDTSEAEAMEGVLGVFTHENTPLKTYNNYVNCAGQPAPADERLFDQHVRFVGDRVAGVVATSTEIARKAITCIRVVYEELPVALNYESAMAENAPLIHENGNLLSKAELNTGSASDEISRSGAAVYRSFVHIQRIHHAAMENHVCLAEYDDTNGITIWSPCQGVFGIRHNVASFLDMRYCDVRVIKAPTGGSFGGKQQTCLEILAAYLALKTRSRVLLAYDRPQSILSTSVATAMDLTTTSVVSDDNKIIAMDIEALTEAGAYATNSLILPISAGKKAFRLYRVPNIHFHSQSYYTNAPAGGGFRGWGGPQIFAAIETHIDEIARQRGLDRVTLRLDNLVHPNDMDTCLNIPLGNAQIIDCVTQGVNLFDWKKRLERCDRFNQKAQRYRRGVGIACTCHVNGYFGSVQDYSNMNLKLNEDGSLQLNTATHDQGCGTLLSLSIIVAEVLDVPIESVKTLEADTGTSPYDVGTYASRVTYVAGRCAYEAALSMKELILSCAATLLNEQKETLSIKDGAVFQEDVSLPPLRYGEIATAAQSKLKRELSVQQRYENTSNPGAYGCHFSEVEVDTYTGLARVIDYLAVHDVGQALNRCMVEGQIQGAVQIGIGYALSEEVALDENGNPLATNFDKYTVVNAPDMPNVRVCILEHGKDEGPFGAKSIGESALLPVAATIMNAVNHALETSLNYYPLTPKRIVEALYKNERGIEL
ncbi:MAG: molybdopterin cofactor-binding domain-containing protein [Clostridia bacterium]